MSESIKEWLPGLLDLRHFLGPLSFRQSERRFDRHHFEGNLGTETIDRSGHQGTCVNQTITISSNKHPVGKIKQL